MFDYLEEQILTHFVPEYIDFKPLRKDLFIFASFFDPELLAELEAYCEEYLDYLDTLAPSVIYHIWDKNEIEEFLKDVYFYKNYPDDCYCTLSRSCEVCESINRVIEYNDLV